MPRQDTLPYPTTVLCWSTWAAMKVPSSWCHTSTCMASLTHRHYSAATCTRFTPFRVAPAPAPARSSSRRRIWCSSEEQEPAIQFSSLASKFNRRLGVGLLSGSVVVIGSNLGGITSLLLGLRPHLSRVLKLDVVYPVLGFKRYLDTSYAFEFVYPSSWVGDKTLLYRAVEREEQERLFGPSKRRLNEPIVAFGPPGTSGELNVSVIVSQVPNNFSIEAFGDPTEQGDLILKKLVVPRGSNITATLLGAKKREKHLKTQKVTYYYLEYSVQSPMFCRYNVAVYTSSSGKLYTFNAQSPERLWSTVKNSFYEMANSFQFTS